MAESLFFDRLAEVIGSTTSDTDKTVERLVGAYPSYSALAAAELDDIAAVTDERCAHLVRLCYAIAERRVTDSFRFGVSHSEEQIVEYFKARLYGRAREVSYVMLLDKEGRVIGCEFLGEGTVNLLAVTPRRVLEIAVKKKAASVIIAHNHPGGVATPSCEDIDATHAIATLFEASGRRVLAHYVFAGDKHGVIIPNEKE